MTLEDALAQERFDECLVEMCRNRIWEPGRPTFLYDYPAKLAALARLKNNDPDVSERFELYIGGVEIANGFSELTDREEQRKTFRIGFFFRKARREKLGALRHAGFLSAIACNVARLRGYRTEVSTELVMLMAGAKRLDDVIAFFSGKSLIPMES